MNRSGSVPTCSALGQTSLIWLFAARLYVPVIRGVRESVLSVYAGTGLTDHSA